MYRVVLDGTAARPRPLKWPKPRFGRWSYAAATAFVLAIVAGAVAWNGYWREPACALVSEKPSIAVLPFDYVGEDPKRSRIADGLSEDVIGNLSRLGDLFVIAETPPGFTRVVVSTSRRSVVTSASITSSRAAFKTLGPISSSHS